MAAKKRRRKKNRARRGRSKPRRKRAPSPAVAAKASTEPSKSGKHSEPDSASALAEVGSEFAAGGRPRGASPEVAGDGRSGASPVVDGRRGISPEVVADDRRGDTSAEPVADERPSEVARAAERSRPMRAPKRRAERADLAAEPQASATLPPFAAVARGRARHGFFRGMAFGIGVVVPVLAATLYILCQLGVAVGRESLFACLRYALVFAGVPAVITWGGITRALVRRMRAGERSGVRAGVATSAAGSAAGAALIFLVAIPAGALSAHVTDYVWVAAGGAGGGLLCGVAVGVWIVWPFRRARAAGAAAAPPSPTSISGIADIPT